MEKAIITVYFNGLMFKSIPLDIENEQQHIDLVLNISEYGLDKLQLLKFPTSETSFITFSKSQLVNCVCELEIITEENIKKKSKRNKKDNNDELLLS